MYRSGIIGYGAGPRRGYLGAGIGYPYGAIALPYYGGYGYPGFGYGYPGCYGYGLGCGLGYGYGYYGSGGLL
jgi:hypothetical protein